MKILRVISSIDPKGGGPTEGLYQSSKILLELGHSTDILSLDSSTDDFTKEGDFPIHAMGPGMSSYCYSRKLMPWLHENAIKYDAVIVHGIWQYHSYAVQKYFTKIGKSYYLFTHGMLDPWFKKTYPLKHLKKWMYWRLYEYYVIKNAKLVFFTTEEEKNLAPHSFRPYDCNAYVVSYGTGGHTGDKDKQLAAFFEAFPNLREKRLFLFLSRIHPKKGLDTLIKAFAEISRGLDVHLVIAGPDQLNWSEELKSLSNQLGISEKITWTGMLKGDLKWGAYLAAEVFVLPSHQENFGIVVAEALSCSIPVLTTNKVNIWREIEKDEAGIISDDSLDGCIASIKKWIGTDNAMKTRMQNNAINCFKNRFENTAAATSLLNAISQ